MDEWSCDVLCKSSSSVQHRANEAASGASNIRDKQLREFIVLSNGIVSKPTPRYVHDESICVI